MSSYADALREVGLSLSVWIKFNLNEIKWFEVYSCPKKIKENQVVYMDLSNSVQKLD